MKNRKKLFGKMYAKKDVNERKQSNEYEMEMEIRFADGKI